MADPVLKFPAEQKQDGAAAAAAAPARAGLGARLRRHRRVLLLVVAPLAVAAVALAVYLAGGRYVTTDNAYVGAQKVLVTPDVSGKIARTIVTEGQQVAAGDVMFEIDPVPFQLALARAEARVAQVETDLANLKADDAALTRLIALASTAVDLRQRDVDRKTALVAGRAGSQYDLDASVTALVAAQNQLEQLRQQQAAVRNRLRGDPKLAREAFPPWREAVAARDQAQRDLDHTRVRAPIDGVATRVDNIQIGRFVAAGTPTFSIVDLSRPWIDANPKESDLTHVAPGQPVTVTVDAFPDHVFKARVGALSPGTGAEFAILPPQNATGNFVKIVQRVPVRIYFDDNEAAAGTLKAGMSAYVSIDTGHRRTLAGLLGLAPAGAGRAAP